MYRPLLPPQIDLSDDEAKKVKDDYQRFAEDGLPGDVEDYLREAYQVDVASRYAGFPLRNPWGKGSGQLSLQAKQVQMDADSRLGFVILKTVIAQDEQGEQMMKAWAIKETRMVVEKVTSMRSGAEGWTVSWKGRGWYETLEKYLEFMAASLEIGRQADMLIVPSCKYHLPTPSESGWKEEEYDYTTGRMLEVWKHYGIEGKPMPLEKDFSPTLAGSDRSRQQEKILEWLRTVPRLIHKYAEKHGGADSILLGIKVFNAMFSDEFQLEMMRRLHAVDESDPTGRPDFLIYANRLFDPDRKVGGREGIAFGGAELSERNLSILADFRRAVRDGGIDGPPLPLSATGDVWCGRVALEYALRGCENFQIHTYFQLPNDQYAMKTGPKTARALHELYFNPVRGLLPWMLHLRREHNLVNADGMTALLDIVDWNCDAPHPLLAQEK